METPQAGSQAPAPAPSPRAGRLAEWTRSPAALVTLAALGVLWAAPTIGLGLLLDDRMHRDFVQLHLMVGELQADAFDMFGIARNQSTGDVRMKAYVGLLPWWSSDDFSVSFLRPLAVATHYLDYGLWPELPWLMHVHNLLWYGAMLLLVGALYRRLLGPGVAALALLIFALDEAHVDGVAWLAGRNTVMTSVFIAATLLVHDRGCRGGLARAIWLSPLLLLLGFLSSEGAIATWAYLLPHAWLIDRRPVAERVNSLMPLAAVTLAWQMLYRGMGYGARGSELFVDPGASPLRFALALIERYPIVLQGQLGIPHLAGLVGMATALLVLGVVIGTVVSTARGVSPCAPEPGRPAAGRALAFLLVGMLLAAVPVCAVEVSPRLLFPVSIGACGLLGHGVVAGVGLVRAGTPGLRALGALTAVTVGLVHLAVPLLVAPLVPGQLRGIDERIAKSASTLPWDERVQGSVLAVLNAPNFFIASLELQDRVQKDGAVPRVAYLLGTSETPVKLSRPGPNHLMLEPVGGYLSERWATMVRAADDPFEKHDMRRLAGMLVGSDEVTPDGRPARILIAHHDRDGPIHWVIWNGERRRYELFELPPVGSEVLLTSGIPLR